MNNFIYYYDWFQEKFYILLLERQTVYNLPFPAAGIRDRAKHHPEFLTSMTFARHRLNRKLELKKWPQFIHPEVEKNLADCRDAWIFDLDSSIKVAKYNCHKFIDNLRFIEDYINFEDNFYRIPFSGLVDEFWKYKSYPTPDEVYRKINFHSTGGKVGKFSSGFIPATDVNEEIKKALAMAGVDLGIKTDEYGQVIITKRRAGWSQILRKDDDRALYVRERFPYSMGPWTIEKPSFWSRTPALIKNAFKSLIRHFRS